MIHQFSWWDCGWDEGWAAVHRQAPPDVDHSPLDWWFMADQTYYSAMLQVPASETPDDMNAARRPFSILRHGGMVAFRIGPVDVLGIEGDDYTVLLSTGQAKQVMDALEIIRANLGR